jgi:hypothetical protein
MSTEQHINSETSRIYAKREREHTVSVYADYLWEELTWAVRETVRQLNEYWQKDLVQLPKESDVIRIQAPGRQKKLSGSSGHRTFTPQVEIRIDRGKQTAFVKVVEVNPYDETEMVKAKETPWPIKADPGPKTVYFEGPDKNRYTPLALAEHLIAEQLLGMNLDR